MSKLFEKLDAKTILTLVTSVGGLIFAGVLLWQNYKLQTNHIQHLQAAIEVHNEEDGKLKAMIVEALNKNTNAVDNQTKLFELFLRQK